MTVATILDQTPGGQFAKVRFLRTMLAPTYACDSFICTSRAAQKALANILQGVSMAFRDEFGITIGFNGRLDVIPLCADTDQLRPMDKFFLRKELGIPINAFVLLYVGYLSQIKADLGPLLSMIQRLVGANPGVNLLFIVAGTGVEAEIVPGLVESSGSRLGARYATWTC